MKPLVTGAAASALRAGCHALHAVLILYGLLGRLIPSEPWLIVHLVFIPGLIAVWRVNDGVCPLNNLESFLTTGFWRNPTNAEEGAFIRLIVERYLKLAPAQQQMDEVTYGIMAVVWGASWVHLTFV